MYLSSTSETSRPFLTRQWIVEWAEEHYRYRTFRKDERIPTRPGLLYFVAQGALRLIVTHPENSSSSVGAPSPGATGRREGEENFLRKPEQGFLGFVSAGQPFEVVTRDPFAIEAYAHTEETSAIWMYWQDLDVWPGFRQEVLDAFRYQHQRKLLWLATLGQKRTLDRLGGFLTLVVEEHGEPYYSTSEPPILLGYRLPWGLTHAQIGSAIGSTRVTVTRLMGKLRAAGCISTGEDNLIGVPIARKRE